MWMRKSSGLSEGYRTSSIEWRQDDWEIHFEVLPVNSCAIHEEG